MPEALLLGIDVGTTHCKAALFRSDGSLVRLAVRATPTRPLPGGSAEHPAAALLAAVFDALAEGLGPDGGLVEAVGVASMAEAGVPLDAAGQPLASIIPWYDPCTAPQAAAIAARFGEPALFAATGLRPEPKYTLAKLLWLRAEAPAVLAGMHAWAGVAEYVAHALTGALGTDPSLASRTMAFDVTRGGWRADLLALAGLRPEQMPPVLAPGAAVGAVTATAAAVTGLPAGVPVVVAGHDHVVGAFAVGAAAPGAVLDSMGTAEAVCLTTAAPVLGDAVRRAGFSCGCHVLPGTWYLMGALNSSGALVEWFRQSLLAGGSYDDFLRLLGEVPPAPTGIIVHPFLRGRAGDPGAGVSIGGLRAGHGLAHLARGLLEGTAYELRRLQEALAAVSGEPVRAVRLIGGGTRNVHWLAIKAAVSPWPLVADPDLAAAYDRLYREGYLPPLAAR